MRFQTLDEWLAWQLTLHPREIELGLERVSRVWGQLRPEGLGSLVVSVAGTNGKGSCVALLDSIYRQAGYRVGCYTSPHLVSYNERIRIDAETVTDARLCEVFERIDQARGETPLTYFEFGTLAALDLFAGEQPDLVLLEVGLGGRLDAVNIIDADVALITSIDLDHMDWLGETREQIGAEKAGILRHGQPAVLGQADMPASVLEAAETLRAEVYQYARDFRYERLSDAWGWWGPGDGLADLPLPALQGRYQLQNAAAVLMVCQCMQPLLPVSQAAISRGLTSVRLSGRLQFVAGDPPLVLDVAHNPQAVMALREDLAVLPIRGRVHAIFSLLSDKDVTSIAHIMQPVIASWQLVGLEVGRGQTAQALKARLMAAGIGASGITCHGSFNDALSAARRQCKPQDAILVFGSFVLVGEAMASLTENTRSANNPAVN